MRIALITHKVDLQDGQGRVNFEIAQALLAEGHGVTVVAERCSPEIANHPLGNFVCMRKFSIPTQLLRDLYFAVKSGRWLRQHRQEFDLVQANGFVMWEPADVVAVHFVHGWWLKSPHFPFHWASFSPYAWYQRVFSILNVRFERRAFEQASVLVAVSKATAGEVASLGIKMPKLRVVPNGVDTAEFHPGPSEREAFGLPKDVPLGLFVGDIRTPRKNLGTALHALCAVPELHLAVAGKSEDSPYPELARKLGISERVHFLGLTSRIPALMRSADLLVIPSRYETSGLVVLEAMASGLPVILSSRVGAAEFVGDAGIVVEDPDDVQGLGASYTKIVHDPVAKQAMSEAGPRRARTLQWTDTAQGYIAVYEEMLKKPAVSAELELQTQ